MAITMMSFDILNLIDLLSGRPYAMLTLMVIGFIFTKSVETIQLKGGVKYYGRSKK